MPTLLQLDSSADLTSSVSRAVTATFVDAWLARGPEYQLIRRDLHVHPLPHLADASLHWPARLRTSDVEPPADAESLQQQVIAELISADVVVVGAPMYNYAPPSTLKAWLDYIHVPGVTAPFDGDTQPMAGRPVVLISSRGGIYDPGTPNAGWDHVLPPLQIVLGEALGMVVSTVVVSRTLAGTVPGLASEADRAEAELVAGHRRAAELAQTLGPA